MRSRKTYLQYYLMMLPAVLLLIVFSIIPMGGIVMAFQKFVPAKGIFHSKWVGWKNFSFIFSMPDSWDVIRNTLVIAILKIVCGLVVPVIVALLLNEVRSKSYKRTIQTLIYIPHFLSWVVLGGIFKNMLGSDGIVNQLLLALGMEKPILFLSSNRFFQPVLVVTDCWKGFGYGTIVYLAALTGIDPQLYEAAAIDGAGRGQSLWHVTLPGIRPTIILMATLSLSNVLNAGFDQVFNLYNPLVYETGDIIDTYVYRLGLIDRQFSVSTAVGLAKSVISFVLIALSYGLASKFGDYRIF